MHNRLLKARRVAAALITNNDHVFVAILVGGCVAITAAPSLIRSLIG